MWLQFITYHFLLAVGFGLAGSNKAVNVHCAL